MAFTQTDIDTLKAAIVAGKGVRSLSFDNQTVTFGSVDEMLALLRVMEAEVATTAATRRTYRVVATNKGV